MSEPEPEPAPEPAAEPGPEPAAERVSWRVRAAALGIDLLPAAIAATAMALTALCLPIRGALWWVCVVVAAVAVLAAAVNRLLLAPIIGWSLGRAVAGNPAQGYKGQLAKISEEAVMAS